MNQQFKKNLSIALAILVGLGIIFFAWRNVAPTDSKVSFEPTVSGDSWKGSLLAIPKTSFESTKGLSQGAIGAEATTTTDLLARELLVSYAILQQRSGTTTMSDADAQDLAQMLASKVALPQGTVYTAKNLNTVNDNSDAAFAAYASNVGDVMRSFSIAHKTNELALVSSAIATKDASKLKGLTTIIAQYRALQKSLLAISTPTLVAPLHLRLVQNYANIEAAVMGMQKIISDPVLGLAALSQYKKTTDALDALALEYRDYNPTR